MGALCTRAPYTLVHPPLFVVRSAGRSHKTETHRHDRYRAQARRLYLTVEDAAQSRANIADVVSRER